MRPSIRQDRPRAVAACLIALGVAGPADVPGWRRAAPVLRGVARGLPGARLARPDARADDHLGARAVGQDAFARSHGGLLPDRLPPPLPLPGRQGGRGAAKGRDGLRPGPIEAHAVQNIGDAECRIVMAKREARSRARARRGYRPGAARSRAATPRRKTQNSGSIARISAAAQPERRRRAAGAVLHPAGQRRQPGMARHRARGRTAPSRAPDPPAAAPGRAAP